MNKYNPINRFVCVWAISIAFSCFYNYLRADIDDGLIVHLALDDAEGTVAADSSGNENEGTLFDFASAGTQWIEGQFDNGLELGGGHIAADGLPNMSATTWATWVKLTSDSNYGAAISATFEGAGAGHSLGFHTGGSIRNPRVLWNHNAGHLSIISPDAVELGEWNHLALTYNPDEEILILYVNGQEKGSGNVGTSEFSSINIGRRESSENSPLNGGVDDVAIFDRALSADEIMDLVNGEEITDGLILNWKLNETDGLVANDSSGNDHHGALEGFPPAEVEDWTIGRVDGALDFSKAAHVGVSGFPEMIDTTWSVWVNLNAQPNYGAAISATFDGAGAGHSLGFHTGGTAYNPRILWNHNAGHASIISPEPVAQGEWNHLLMTYDSTAGEAALFVNGEEKGRSEVGTNPFSSINLGRRESSANTYLNAIIDEVRIYNRVLDTPEIQELASLGAPSGPPEIVKSPESQTRYEGSTARFSVEATGAEPLRYLWFKGEEPLRDQTESTFIIQHLKSGDEGEYSVRVSNDAGEVKSETVSLSVTGVEGIQTARQLFLKLDESTGLNAADDSGNDNNGTLEGFPDDSGHWTDGQVDGGLAFDGAGGFVSIENSDSLSNLSDEASFAFWLNIDSYGPEENAGTFNRAASFLLSKGNHFHVKIIDDPGSVARTLVVRGAEGDATSAVPKQASDVNAVQGTLTLDNWQHWIIVYRNGKISFYQNGFRVGEPEEGMLGAPNMEPLTIGDFDSISAGLRNLSGVIDELSIWGRPLSETEILELAGRDVTGPPVIASQPNDRKRLEGSSTFFEVFVSGKRPVTYQWFKDGSPIEGAQSSRFEITKISTEDAGDYTVAMTNSQGEVTTEAATLEVETLGDVTSGLVAYYPFNEEDGDKLKDASGNGIDGDLQNFDDGFSNSGVVGGAFSFDGLDDFIIVPHNDLMNLTDQATVSVWLNPVSVSNNGDFDRVLRKDVNFDLVLINGGVARVHGINKTPYSSPADTVVNGEWQHFAYTFKNEQVQWYKNGAPVGPPIPGNLGATNSNPLVISNFKPSNDIPRLFEGLMDELGIWQRALSASAIAGIYENGLRGKPLNVEFEPLNIRSVGTEVDKISIVFFTPFENREHKIITKTDFGIDGWTNVQDVEIADLGPGLFQASFDPPASGAGFYRVSAISPPPLFEANFEDGGLEGWTRGGNPEGLWEVGPPVTGPDGAAQGSNVLATDLDGNFVDFTDSFIRTPEIDLSNINSATLNFREWFSVDDVVDFHQVIVNVVEPGAENGEVLVELSRSAGTTPGWTEKSLRLTGDAVGRKIQIEFRLVTDDFRPLPGWYIDEVSITEN